MTQQPIPVIVEPCKENSGSYQVKRKNGDYYLGSLKWGNRPFPGGWSIPLEKLDVPMIAVDSFEEEVEVMLVETGNIDSQGEKLYLAKNRIGEPAFVSSSGSVLFAHGDLFTEATVPTWNYIIQNEGFKYVTEFTKKEEPKPVLEELADRLETMEARLRKLEEARLRQLEGK